MRVLFSYFAINFLWAMAGSFFIAYLHEKTGRDVTRGGIIGSVVGLLGGPLLLGLAAIWIYFGSSKSEVRIYGIRDKPWYRWWDSSRIE